MTFKRRTMLPYILLADNDPRDQYAFHVALDRQIPYAWVTIVDDGRELLFFLEGCDRKDLPSIILIGSNLPDATAPEVLKELSANTGYSAITKLVWGHQLEAGEKDKCMASGAIQYLEKPGDIFGWDDLLREIDGILKSELDPL